MTKLVDATLSPLATMNTFNSSLAFFFTGLSIIPTQYLEVNEFYMTSSTIIGHNRTLGP